MNDQNRHNGHNGHHGPDDEIDLRLAHPADRLSALLDGELDDRSAGAVRQHLDGCEPCRVELDDIAAVRQALRAMPAMPAPPGFVGRVVDQRHRANRRGVAITLLAAALAVVIGVVAAGDPGSGGRSGEPSEQAGVAAPPTSPPGDEPPVGTRLQRWDAGRPGPDVKLSLPARRDAATSDDDDSVLDRAHEVGRDLLDALGG